MSLEQTLGPLCEGYDAAYVPSVAYVEQGDKVWFLYGTRELTESVDAGKTVVESITDLELVEREGRKYVKDGKYYVEGTYQRSDVENANKRKYPRKIWERTIADPNSRFMQGVKSGGVVGHIEHPTDGRTDGTKIAMKHLDFRLEKDGRVWGRSMLTSNTPGKELQALTDDGVRWGVSSRGSGSVGSDGTVNENDFQLETFDAVMKPSTPGAFPTLTPGGTKPVKEEEGELLEGEDAVKAYVDTLKGGHKSWALAKIKHDKGTNYRNSPEEVAGRPKPADHGISDGDARKIFRNIHFHRTGMGWKESVDSDVTSLDEAVWTEADAQVAELDEGFQHVHFNGFTPDRAKINRTDGGKPQSMAVRRIGDYGVGVLPKSRGTWALVHMKKNAIMATHPDDRHLAKIARSLASSHTEPSAGTESLDEAGSPPNPFHKALTQQFGFRKYESPINGDTKQHYERGDPGDSKKRHNVSVSKDDNGQWKWKHSWGDRNGVGAPSTKEGMDHVELDRRMNGMGIKKKIKEEESTDDASACIVEVTSLTDTDVMTLNESEATDLTVRLIKSLGRVNSLDKSKDLPTGKAHDLRDWLTRKLGEVYYRRPSKTAPSVVTESHSSSGAGKSPKELAYERVVNGLRESVNDANRDAAEQRKLSEALQGRLSETQVKLDREKLLREAAVKQAAAQGKSIADKTRQLDTALATIEELTVGEVENPISAAVAEVVGEKPQLARFSELLERSGSPEEVYQYAKELSGKSSGGENGAGRTRAHAPRPTLPQGRLISEDAPAGFQSRVGTSHRGAKAAAGALARMKSVAVQSS